MAIQNVAPSARSTRSSTSPAGPKTTAKTAPLKASAPGTSNGEAPARKTPRLLVGNAQPDDASRKSALGLYETAIKLMQAGKFEKAHEAFNKMLAVAPPDLAERIRMYITACVQQMAASSSDFETNEERYDYAVSLLNHGHYEDAREHLLAILKKKDSADYAFYGLALLSSMTGDSENCLKHLTEAIRLNGRNRLQARMDSDFDGVADDPRFTELLYPES